MNKRDKMLLDKTNTTNIKLVWDCEFYYRVLDAYTKANNPAVFSLLASTITRECTVFVLEMAKYLPDIESAISESSSSLFEDAYKIIRNRIHYFTSKPFNYLSEKSSTESLVYEIQKHHMTRPKDDISFLRYDLSYIKSDEMLYCSSYDVNALIYGTQIWKNGAVIPNAIKQYCFDLASIISSVRQGFNSSDISQIMRLNELKINTKNININFYDGKFDLAVERTGFSVLLTAISLRIISDIGSVLYLVQKLFINDWDNTYYLYFFTRLIAIRFDEISDAIYAVDKHFPKEESKSLLEMLKSNNIYPFPEYLRLVAKKLRNTIHYNSSNEIWSIEMGNAKSP